MVMQIRLEPEGAWHRRARGSDTQTACGQPIGGAFVSRDQDKHPESNGLCQDGCWTRHEIDTGQMAKIAREAEEDDPSLYFNENDEPTDPNGDAAIVKKP